MASPSKNASPTLSVASRQRQLAKWSNLRSAQKRTSLGSGQRQRPSAKDVSGSSPSRNVLVNRRAIGTALAGRKAATTREIRRMSGTAHPSWPTGMDPQVDRLTSQPRLVTTVEANAAALRRVMSLKIPTCPWLRGRVVGVWVNVYVGCSRMLTPMWAKLMGHQRTPSSDRLGLGDVCVAVAISWIVVRRGTALVCLVVWGGAIRRAGELRRCGRTAAPADMVEQAWDSRFDPVGCSPSTVWQIRK